MGVRLTDDELNTIRGILRTAPGVQRAALFGSRAMRNARKGSDVDLVLFGRLGKDDVPRIRMSLEEETCLPYFFDVIAYDDIENEDLKKHIAEWGTMVYEA